MTLGNIAGVVIFLVMIIIGWYCIVERRNYKEYMGYRDEWDQ